LLGTVAAATAAGLSGLAYLDAKFHIRKDLTAIRRMSRGMEAWQNAGEFVAVFQAGCYL